MKGHITYEGQITVKGVNAICETNWLSDQMKKSLITLCDISLPTAGR
jgi:hypothetical protein